MIREEEGFGVRWVKKDTVVEGLIYTCQDKKKKKKTLQRLQADPPTFLILLAHAILFAF
jgi:hypothetical protein